MNLLIQEMTKSDFEHFIKKTMSEVLKKHYHQTYHKKPSESRYLSRKETARFLKISLVTLSTLTAKKKLTGYRIGKRILYKQEELEKALVKINNFKEDE